VRFSGRITGQGPRQRLWLYVASCDLFEFQGLLSCKVVQVFYACFARRTVCDWVDQSRNKQTRSTKFREDEDAMSTQPWPVTPALQAILNLTLTANRQPYSWPLTGRRCKNCLARAKSQHIRYSADPAVGGQLGGTSSANLTSGRVLSDTPL
jgi:hypothetical protein